MIDHDKSMCAEPHIRGTRVSVWAVALASELGQGPGEIATQFRVGVEGVHAALVYTQVHEPPKGYLDTIKWMEAQ